MNECATEGQQRIEFGVSVTVTLKRKEFGKKTENISRYLEKKNFYASTTVDTTWRV